MHIKQFSNGQLFCNQQTQNIRIFMIIYFSYYILLADKKSNFKQTFTVLHNNIIYVC